MANAFLEETVKSGVEEFREVAKQSFVAGNLDLLGADDQGRDCGSSLEALMGSMLGRATR